MNVANQPPNATENRPRTFFIFDKFQAAAAIPPVTVTSLQRCSIMGVTTSLIQIPLIKIGRGSKIKCFQILRQAESDKPSQKCALLAIFSRRHATLHLVVSVRPSVRNIFELRAIFASLLLPNRPQLDCCVSGLV